MNKIKKFIFSEKKLSGTIFGILIIIAIAFTFGPNIYAQFAIQTGGTGYGYGYGYGYGHGSDGGANSYRITGNDPSTYDYGYGWVSNASAVNLGAAGNFVILAKTGISTTGLTSIVGDLGISPAPATYITGFSLNLTAGSAYSTSALVTGKIYAPGYTDPTPANLTTAVSNMETAYTDAAGRTNPTATELGAGNIGGMTLVPGLYKWSSDVKIPTNLTLSGDANGVWIFQIAGNLTVSSGVHIILSSGAQANNIFWVVAGQTTLGTADVFNGNILDQTAIVLQTGAVLNGRALAQSAVTLDANSVIVPSENGDITYSWSQSGFSACSATCGTGTKTQTVICINNNSGQTVNNSLCTGTEPNTSQACNIQSCSSGGSSSSASTNSCTTLIYSTFGACTNGFQFRSVVSKSPTSCSLTTAQQIAAQQACTTITNANGEVITIPTSEEPSLVASVTALEKSLMKKINSALTNRLKGRILLQIQEKGQAWYVNPLDGSKYYLGRAADAFSIMRAFGLGMSNKTYNSFVAAGNKAPARLAGRILINVDDSGKAYYVNPLDLKLNYLGKPADAYSIMRTLGLGITNDNIRQIKVGEIK